MINGLKLRPLVKGALTFVPGLTGVLPERGGQTRSASYCYGVWLKHLCMLWGSGMREVPRTLAELGPGDSLGTGIAAMLSGVDHYRGLDVVEHSSIAANLRIFDELVALFQQRAPRPVKGWPDFDQYLDARLFPGQLLGDEVLARTLAPARLARLRQAIAEPQRDQGDVSLRYIAPWSDPAVIEPESVDVIISHAVLGEVSDLPGTYAALGNWLRPGGWMSHQVGLEFPGINGAWNGYWSCPEPLWEVIKGRRPFILNRQPRSTHLNLLRQLGLELVCVKELLAHDGITRNQLSEQWRDLTDEDFYCAGLYVQARKW